MFTFLLFFPVLHVKSNYLSAQVTSVLSLRLSSHWRHILRTSRQRNNKMKSDVKRNAMQSIRSDIITKAQSAWIKKPVERLHIQLNQVCLNLN